MDKSLYRKNALKKLSEPEKLDKAIRVTLPRYWIIILGAVIIVVALLIWACNYTMEIKVPLYGIYVVDGDSNSYSADNDGVVKAVYKKPGDTIYKGDLIYDYLDGSKPAYKSPVSGVVSDVKVNPGTEVKKGNRAIIIRSFNNKTADAIYLLDQNSKESTDQAIKKKKVIAVCPAEYAEEMVEGMDAQVYLTYIDDSMPNAGYMSGKIRYVSSQALSDSEVENSLGISNETFGQLSEYGVLYTLEIELDKDDTSKSGYKWSEEYGEELDLPDNTVTKVFVITYKMKPIDLLFPNL